MTVLAIAGEAWELPFAVLTAVAARRHDDRVEVVVPVELAGVAAALEPGLVRVVGAPPGRFRGLSEIAGELSRLAGPAARVVPAGSVAVDGVTGEPVHRPPAVRAHRCRPGELPVWTVDTGEHYFAALAGAAHAAEPVRVWPQYGARRPVFTRNTNDFAEPAPGPCDDYWILGSGLLGWRMVVESDPGPGARVSVYDINPDQLAWSRHVLTESGRCASLDELAARFRAARPDIDQRAVLPHERANAERQADWYSAHRHRIAEIGTRLPVDFVVADLLTSPATVLDRLAPERRVFFMYLDLFVVWHLDQARPWITEFPGIARSLEHEVRRRCAAALFLPGPQSRRVQLTGSPLTRDEGAEIACT